MESISDDEVSEKDCWHCRSMYHIFNNIQANWLLIRVSKSDNVDYVKIVSLAKGAKMERS